MVPMSAEPGGVLSGASQVGLSEDVRKRLGNLIAAAYAQEDAERDAAGRFANLLAELDTALGKALTAMRLSFRNSFSP